MDPIIKLSGYKVPGHYVTRFGDSSVFPEYVLQFLICRLFVGRVTSEIIISLLVSDNLSDREDTQLIMISYIESQIRHEELAAVV